MNGGKSMKPGAFLQLAGWIALTAAFAALGAFASVHAAVFYAQLDRPGWAPPAWLFGPVWSLLYLMMAIAAWRVGRTAASRAYPALLLYLAQLAVNALWSWLFFAWHLGAAFACIVVLWLMIAATIVLFGRRERLAAMLLWPYLAWVSFAGGLCFCIWQRNPSLLG